MHPANPTAPSARLAVAIMAAASALAVACFGVLRVLPATADRYHDTPLEAALAQGLPWIAASVVQAPLSDRAPENAVSCVRGLSLPERFACERQRLNAQLRQLHPPRYLPAAAPPDAALLRDAVVALAWLRRNVRSPARLAEVLDKPSDYAGRVGRSDPFRLRGCLYRAGPVEIDTRATGCPFGPTVDKDDLPRDAAAFLARIDTYVMPNRGASPNTVTHEPVPGLKTSLAQGRHLWIGPAGQTQIKAQITADCYTGHAAACRQCPWCNTAGAEQMFEDARARGVALLVVDARSGLIEAAASAASACLRLDERGGQPGPDCPRLPATRHAGAANPGNAALEQTAMPGSQNKIPLVLALAKSGLTPSETARLPSIITHSRTEELIGLVLCASQDFDPACARRRLLAIQAMAVELGWSANSTDALAAGQVRDLRLPGFTGRLLVSPTDPNAFTPERLRLPVQAIRSCGERPETERWRRCAGAALSDVLAELFGAGHSQVSLIGMANPLLHVAAALDSRSHVATAHLIAAAQTASGDVVVPQATHVTAVNAAQAKLLVDGMARVHIQGTARSACSAAAAAGGVLSCRDGTTNTLRLAGKTGTPPFSADRLTLPQWREHCAAIRRRAEDTPQGSASWWNLKNELGKCAMRPIKWYAVLVGAPGGTGWQKIIVARAERNWNRATGLVDSPRDVGPNVAAEAALALANALYAPADAWLPVHSAPR